MTTGLDPIALQVLVGALRATCEEMGAVLIRAAHSANIKERHDCSTAIFDSGGELVMQAEHIPVHLGSMPEAVAAILDRDLEPGVEWILNDPFEGGTHLPDITLIRPLFAGSSLIGFAASRAHHADVGGPTPGSMPADSKRLEDEGVVIGPTPIGAGVLEGLVSQMRFPEQRLADLRAQAAANATAERRIEELIESKGSDHLDRGFKEILGYTERRARAAIAGLRDGGNEAVDALEAPGGGLIELRVRAEVDDELLVLDFSGSAPQVEGNLNCPLAVTRSAALFAVRALTDPDAPPSAGFHRPIRIIAPSGSVLNAEPGAAVAAGNVETSCRVADLVIEALAAFTEAPAQGQGTMNNLTLTGEGFTYYETIGGGQGACADADGPAAVHVTMSNTLNTPVEAFETEFPLRVRRLEVRRDSGGAGARKGGDGIVRELEALVEVDYSLIAERRERAPAGRDGGEDGRSGADTVNGEPIAAKSRGRLAPGDVLRIETPGGGGYGEAG